MNEVFLDTETTGLSFRDGHKIVEIACVETKDLIPTGNVFHKLINPKRSMPNEAFKVHGFSEEFLKSKDTFDLIADGFLDFIKNKKIIIHNAAFDLSFLNYELKLINENEISKSVVIDTLEIARQKFPGSQNSLDALCKRFNVDNSRREKHNALLDCKLLREVYINLVDQKEPKLDFKNMTISTVNFSNTKSNKPKKIVLPSNEEIKMHKEYLKKNLPKNFYN